MLKIQSVIFSLFVLTILFSACKKDDPIIPNEEEVITTLTYTLTPMDGGAPVVLSFQDLDGDGGNAPILTNGTIEANKNYTGVLDLLNEQASPAESITAEVAEEGEDHQFFFQTTIAGLTISYDDQDGNRQPIGLKTNLMATNTGEGTITITLRHEPNKAATGVADGEIANAGGETDIAVTFEINVQ